MNYPRLTRQMVLPQKSMHGKKSTAVLQNKPQRFEWIHKKLDGTLFDADVSLNTIEFKEQTVLLAIVRDITQRKKNE